MLLNKFALLLIVSYAIHLTVSISTSDDIDLQSLDDIKYDYRYKSSMNFSPSDEAPYSSNGSSADTIDVEAYFEDELYSLPVKILLSTLATTTSLITISGNLLVMCSFFLDRQIRNPTNYFILSLSVSDFLIGMFSMPLYTLYLMLDRWPFGEVICNLWLSLDYTVCLTSIYTVLFITIDRFCSVKIPAKYRKWRSPNKIILMIALTWIVPSSLFFTSIFAWSYSKKFDPKNCAAGWSSNAAFSLVLMFGYFWSTLTVIIILYIFIYQVAKDLERKHLEKQTKVNALVGSATVNRFKNTLTSDVKTNCNSNIHTNTTNLNAMNVNTNLKIPKTIAEKSGSSSDSKPKDYETKTSNNQPVKQNSNQNINSSYASTASKEDFSSDSDHDLKQRQQHHLNETVKITNNSRKITQRPETLAVVVTNHTDHIPSPPKPPQIQLHKEELSNNNNNNSNNNNNNSNSKCASNFNPIEIIDETDQKLIEIPSLTQPAQQIPFIDDEFEELNYVLHRRQLGHNEKPIKEETILIKSPLKNGFFQKISLSIKSFSRRSSQKSLIDISSGNDSTEKSKLESLCLNRNENASSSKKITNDTLQVANGTHEERVSLLNDNSNEKKEEKTTNELSSTKPKEDAAQPVQEKHEEPNRSENKVNHKNEEEEEEEDREDKLPHSDSFQPKLSDLGKTFTAVGNQISTLVNNQLGSKHDLKDPRKKQAKFENRARKALRTITFILGAFVFCFAPFHIVSIFDLFCTICSSSKFYRHFFNTCYFLCYLNSPINPFMYALANQQFKKTFLRILKGDLRRS